MLNEKLDLYTYKFYNEDDCVDTIRFKEEKSIFYVKGDEV